MSTHAIKPIRTEDDHSAAIEEIAALWNANPAPPNMTDWRFSAFWWTPTNASIVRRPPLKGTWKATPTNAFACENSRLEFAAYVATDSKATTRSKGLSLYKYCVRMIQFAGI